MWDYGVLWWVQQLMSVTRAECVDSSRRRQTLMQSSRNVRHSAGERGHLALACRHGGCRTRGARLAGKIAAGTMRPG